MRMRTWASNDVLVVSSRGASYPISSVTTRWRSVVTVLVGPVDDTAPAAAAPFTAESPWAAAALLFDGDLLPPSGDRLPLSKDASWSVSSLAGSEPSLADLAGFMTSLKTGFSATGSLLLVVANGRCLLAGP